RRVVARGLNVDEFAGRLSFNFDIFGNLFEQVAKFRAARRLWAKLMRDEFGAQSPDTLQMKMIAGGGGFGLTIEEPENNIVRGAYYALISALSGAQTMALCCFDEAYTIPSEKASLISLRTMQILADEMGLTDTADPLAGSYYIEWLTGEMEQRIAAEMKRVDVEMGGIVNAVSNGLVQAEVARQALLYEQKIRSGEIVKVGVNKYRVEGETASQEVELNEYSPEATEEQLRRLAQVKAERDASAVQAALVRVRDDAQSGVNIMPAMLQAVRAYATVGEITGELKKMFGEFREPVRW
ncbi:MAG: methylmalonyl-CoA mutase, partial [Nitrospirae bacterium]|nr:methylmalonyl-CoA mutase [Nitrospirota bacterium]